MTSVLAVPEHVAAAIPPEALTPLKEALDRLSAWTSLVPPKSQFFLNERVVSRMASAMPPGANPQHVVAADTLFDVHSMLAAQCAVKSWRAEQLASSVAFAASTWNVTMLALAARALVETAAAFGIESHELAHRWRVQKAGEPKTQADFLTIRQELYSASTQMAFGTRLPTLTAKSKNIQRTNVVTLIDRAAKKFKRKQLREEYELLCDAVHPSWGAAECFWDEAGRAPEVHQLRVLLDRDAVGHLRAPRDDVKPGSPLVAAALSGCAWAIDRLAEDLFQFDQLCKDICLTAKIYVFSNLNYWGIVSPTGAYQPCACGSGGKSRFCVHEFGRS